MIRGWRSPRAWATIAEAKASFMAMYPRSQARSVPASMTGRSGRFHIWCWRNQRNGLAMTL